MRNLNEYKEILERLDTIIGLLSHGSLDPKSSQTESILRLKKIGLKSKQIASIVGTSQNYVNMILSRKKRKKKNGKKE